MLLLKFLTKLVEWFASIEAGWLIGCSVNEDFLGCK